MKKLSRFEGGHILKFLRAGFRTECPRKTTGIYELREPKISGGRSWVRKKETKDNLVQLSIFFVVNSH